MEKQSKIIYYIATGTLGEKTAERKKAKALFFRKKQDTLPVYRCNRSYPYAGGKPSVAGKPAASGEVWIYFSILPENIEDNLKKPRRRKRWLGRLQNAMRNAEEKLEGTGTDDILFSDKLCRLFDRKQDIPQELYGAFLWMCKKRKSFTHVGIILPQEYGLLMTESVKTLLEPYLAGVNRVTFLSGETEETRELEDFFYHEYGIVADYGSTLTDKSVCLNLANGREILKLLDTAVKSGYNTEVN